MKRIQIFVNFLVCFSFMLTSAQGAWKQGLVTDTGIVPFYVDYTDSKKPEIFFLLGRYPVQQGTFSLYANFRGPITPGESILDAAARIGYADTQFIKQEKNDVQFWKSQDDLKNQLYKNGQKVDIRHNYSFYLVDVTEQVDKMGGRTAVIARKFIKSRTVIWINAEEYSKSVEHSPARGHHIFQGHDVSHFFFTPNDKKLRDFLDEIKKNYPVKNLDDRLTGLNATLTQLKTTLSRLTR